MSSQGEKAGQYPFTKGIYEEMYRSRKWTMRQYAGFSSAKDSNVRYRYLLDQGTTGLSVAFDLPTQIGYDSDDPIAEGEIGKVGVPIDTLADMEVLFEGIPLDKVSTSMTINSTAIILLAMYQVVAEKQGVSSEELRGTIQNDVLKEYIARGTYIYPPQASLRLITDVFSYCNEHIPNWNTISISGYHIREAGSTASQELAFTFANGIAYVEAAIAAGLDVNKFGARLSFFWNAHNDLMEEVAKFRASRRIWAKIMKERFGATNPKAMMCRFHTQTGGSTLTAQQIDNNIPRVTIQALAAVLGGTQSLHTNSRDEALALPTEESARLALRTQQVIGYESGVTNYVDPLAGSEVIENLTDKLEEEVFEYLKKVDELGGAVKAIELGYFQNEIGNSAYQYQQDIEQGERIVIGQNKFIDDQEIQPEILKLEVTAALEQLKELKFVKDARDGDALEKSLSNLKAAAQNTETNLYPFILSAVREYASIGEISNTLRSVFGEYQGQ
ncbi:MAG: methylmalonyl-CoA mutase [Candidatus Marinimicrobia bacterium]|jgi:methylmalonyl-CoA mutase N-terminal domain/subunit|nr:methylmalonyl-CoA mutase [Candidatus Neomarinimicrobiota bacterium]MBT3575152.1 methylmalonyl-CoA mutase [Candidatus Neomarinimicrobiota bacterium]MBT3681061.1 methylmalonyl-CoA mutase [Candidatus Neomarinimicrobiota bacterium]MBT3951454.1 methylmalonyl-CoA mutase [Candidatus Neomarinimicrobiota bacterium]MBT4252886.1 methylmalonyl-CoA mutase [Candidatus Neomarinimicrobiota bacterium]